jgi:hypothetical protein
MYKFINQVSIATKRNHKQPFKIITNNIMAFGAKKFPSPVVMGDEEIMSKKAHGTSEV